MAAERASTRAARNSEKHKALMVVRAPLRAGLAAGRRTVKVQPGWRLRMSCVRLR